MRIGIIGAGQLGQMLGFAARGLGHECFFLDPAERPPAAKAGPVIQAPFDDAVALSVLAEKVDVVTYEFENVPVAAVESLASSTIVRPGSAALEMAQDRAAEVLRDYQATHPAAMRSFSDDLEACLVYLRCLLIHHKSIRTTNLLERAFEEGRRRTKVIPPAKSA